MSRVKRGVTAPAGPPQKDFCFGKGLQRSFEKRIQSSC